MFVAPLWVVGSMVFWEIGLDIVLDCCAFVGWLRGILGGRIEHN